MLNIPIKAFLDSILLSLIIDTYKPSTHHYSLFHYTKIPNAVSHTTNYSEYCIRAKI